ncbi:MAG: N-glycosylase/DNA lyase [Thermoproteota archaeon]
MQENSELMRAIKDFQKFHGKEVVAETLDIEDGKISVLFGGNICNTCGIYDYFEDLLISLEKFSSSSWLIASVEDLQTSYKVTYVKADFIDELKSLKKEIGEKVDKRIKEFEEIKKRGEKDVFKELCFCILTANFTAKGGIKIQEEIDDGFLMLSKEGLEEKLRSLGHRFPKARAEYIFEARKHIKDVFNIVSSNLTGKEIREYLVKNIKGLGYKEASHFLRNVGYKDVAIVDRHILRFLSTNGLINFESKSLTRKRYLEAEKILEAIARKLNLSLAELDLYIWYKMTGEILK